MSIKVNIEIGHEAAIRSKRTIDGFTHDWEVFVRGPDNSDIHYFVEKVVFHLHETFPNPKRVIKDPPYQVRESGYAGFVLPIDVYFRTTDEPKKMRFNYDLNLQPTGPAIIKVKKEKCVFNNPNDEFRHKLMKGGGVICTGGSDSVRDVNDKPLKPKTSVGDIAKKHKVKEHKPEDSFTNLFGTPIKTLKTADPKLQPKISPINSELKEKAQITKKSKSKHSPKEKDKEKDKEKKEKNPDRKHKEEKKKEKSKDKERKEKNVKRDRSPKQVIASPRRSPKRIPSPKRAPSPKPPSPIPVLIKPKEDKKPEDPKEKFKMEIKNKKEQKEKKEHKSNKEKDVVRTIEPKEHKSGKEIKSKELPVKFKEKMIKTDEPVVKEVEKVEKLKPERIEPDKHKHKNKEKKEKKEKKEERIKEKKTDNKIDKNSLFGKTYKDDFKESPKDNEKLTTLKLSDCTDSNSRDKTTKALSALQAELLENSSDSSAVSHDESSVELPAKPVEKVEVKKSKEKNMDSSPEKKRKRKRDEVVVRDEPEIKVDEPPDKIVRDEADYAIKPNDYKKDIEEDSGDYMSILKELQQKIMTLQNNDELQRVVQMIAETGKYEVTTNTFDFDLCALDRDTVQRLQDFFAIS